MHVAVEISLYPLMDGFIPSIEDFTARLRAHPEVRVVTNDGVNIAARLEGLAEPGGLCVSGTAFDHVKNKLSVGYQYLGKQTVKNIPDPVRAYKILMEPEATGKVIGDEERKGRRWGWKAVAAVAGLVLVAGGLVWNFYWRVPKIEPASKEKMVFRFRTNLPSLCFPS